VITPEEWITHFRNLFYQIYQIYNKDIKQLENSGNASAAIENGKYYKITQIDIQKVMKNRKVFSINSITNEMLKCRDQKFKSKLQLFSEKL